MAGEFQSALHGREFLVQAAEEIRVEERAGAGAGRDGGSDGGASAGHGGRDNFAQTVFQRAELAGEIEDEFGVAAVDGGDFHRVARAMADAFAAAKASHAFHGRR